MVKFKNISLSLFLSVFFCFQLNAQEKPKKKHYLTLQGGIFDMNKTSFGFSSEFQYQLTKTIYIAPSFNFANSIQEVSVAHGLQYRKDDVNINDEFLQADTIVGFYTWDTQYEKSYPEEDYKWGRTLTAFDLSIISMPLKMYPKEFKSNLGIGIGYGFRNFKAYAISDSKSSTINNNSVEFVSINSFKLSFQAFYTYDISEKIALGIKWNWIRFSKGSSTNMRDILGANLSVKL